MTAVAASKPTPWAGLSWIVLVLAWIALLLPALRVVAGVPLAVAGLVLALLAARAGRRAGLPVLVAAVLVSPLLYFIGAQDGPLATRVAGDGGSDVARPAVDAVASPAGAATPASTVGALPPEASARAFTASVTAVELASAYTHDRAGADRLYRGKALLLTGMVAGVGRDGAALTLAANDYPPVRVQGLAATAVAALRPERQVTLACTGAGATGNAAEVSDCSMQ